MANLLDKVAGGLNKSIAAVSENSKLIVEKARINTSIQDIEKKKVILTQDLGTLVYNLQTSGEISIEQSLEICNEISNLNNRIDELQQSLQELERFKEIALSRVSTAVKSQSTEETKHCACGYTNKKSAKFCAKCGKQL